MQTLIVLVTMNVYSGIGRRQVGGGLWSTIRRGIPQILRKLKPMAVKVGKHIGKRAVNSALDVGTNVLQGKNIKASLQEEGTNLKNKLKSDVGEKLTGFKRKYLSAAQEGKGNKRRKLTKPTKKKGKMPKRKTTSKRKAGGRKKVYKRKPVRGKKKQATRAGRVSKKKSHCKRKGRKASAVKDIFGK